MHSIAESKHNKSSTSSPERSRRSPDQKVIDRHAEYLAASSTSEVGRNKSLGRWENFGAKLPWEEDYHFVHSRHTDLDFQYNIDRYSRYLWKFYETKKWQEEYAKGTNKIYGSKSPSKYSDAFQDVPTPRIRAKSMSESRYQMFPYVTSQDRVDLSEMMPHHSFTPRPISSSHKVARGLATHSTEGSPDKRRTPPKARHETKESDEKETEKKYYQAYAISALHGRRTRKERQKEKESREEHVERPYSIKKEETPERYKSGSTSREISLGRERLDSEHGKASFRGTRATPERTKEKARESSTEGSVGTPRLGAGSKQGTPSKPSTKSYIELHEKTYTPVRGEKTVEKERTYTPVRGERTVEKKSPQTEPHSKETFKKKTDIYDTLRERKAKAYEPVDRRSMHKAQMEKADQAYLEGERGLIRQIIKSPSPKKDIRKDSSQKELPKVSPTKVEGRVGPKESPDVRRAKDDKRKEERTAYDEEKERAVPREANLSEIVEKRSEGLREDSFGWDSSMERRAGDVNMPLETNEEEGQTKTGHFRLNLEKVPKEGAHEELEESFQSDVDKEFEEMTKSKLQQLSSICESSALGSPRSTHKEEEITTEFPEKKAPEPKKTIESPSKGKGPSATTAAAGSTKKEPLHQRKGSEPKPTHAIGSGKKETRVPGIGLSTTKAQSVSAKKGSETDRRKEPLSAEKAGGLTVRGKAAEEEKELLKKGDFTKKTGYGISESATKKGADLKATRTPDRSTTVPSKTSVESKYMRSPEKGEKSKDSGYYLKDSASKVKSGKEKKYEETFGAPGSVSGEKRKSLPGSRRESQEKLAEQYEEIHEQEDYEAPRKESIDRIRARYEEVPEKRTSGPPSRRGSEDASKRSTPESRQYSKDRSKLHEVIEERQTEQSPREEYVKSKYQEILEQRPGEEEERRDLKKSSSKLERLASSDKFSGKYEEAIRKVDVERHLVRSPSRHDSCKISPEGSPMSRSPSDKSPSNREETTSRVSSRYETPYSTIKSPETEYKTIKRTGSTVSEKEFYSKSTTKRPEYESPYTSVSGKPSPVSQRYDKGSTSTKRTEKESPSTAQKYEKYSKISSISKKYEKESPVTQRYGTAKDSTAGKRTDRSSTPATTKGKGPAPTILGFENVAWNQLNMIRAIENRAALKIQNFFKRFIERRRRRRSPEEQYRNEFQDLINHFRGFEGLYVKLKSTLSHSEANDKVIELALAFMSAYCTMKRPRSTSPRRFY